MASRTQSTYETKPVKSDTTQPDALSDLCGHYRVIGIAAVAAAACAGKSSPRAG